MLQVIRHTDNKGIWLDFAEMEESSPEETPLEPQIPLVAAQIAPNPDRHTPLNMYWWGKSTADQVIAFFSDIVRRNRDVARTGIVRTVEYGADWKSVTENSISEFLSTVKSGHVTVRPDVLSLRLDYAPSYTTDTNTNSEIDNTTISVWSRFDHLPQRDDPDAIESVGIYMPVDELYANARKIEKFVAETTLRPLRPTEFSKVLKRISNVVPS